MQFAQLESDLPNAGELDSLPGEWSYYLLLARFDWFFWTVGGAFWLWMLVTCVRHDPERNLWLWILVLVNPGFPLGAVLYFFIRWLPERRIGHLRLLRRWTRQRELLRLEAAARQIGNAHQFVLWGDALREVGNLPQAATAYAKALEKDPRNLTALWGAAQVDLRLKNFAAGRMRLQQILDIDPGYKFGDVSLAYCRALKELGEIDAARDHLKKHLKRWKQPEAQFLLASILADQGCPTAAREHLDSLLLDLHGAPSFFVRQNRGWRSKAKRLLGKLPRA